MFRRLSVSEQNKPSSNSSHGLNIEKLSIEESGIEINKININNNRGELESEAINEEIDVIEEIHFHTNEDTSAFSNKKLSSSINSIDLNLYM